MHKTRNSKKSAHVTIPETPLYTWMSKAVSENWVIEQINQKKHGVTDMDVFRIYLRNCCNPYSVIISLPQKWFDDLDLEFLINMIDCKNSNNWTHKSSLCGFRCIAAIGVTDEFLKENFGSNFQLASDFINKLESNNGWLLP